MKRIAFLLVGLMFLYLGKDIYTTGKFDVYFGYMVELGIFKPYVVIIYIVIGLYLIYMSYKNKLESDTIEYSKCPQCKTTYNYDELEKGICPQCDIQTIDLDIYFDKYPEELE